MLPLDDIGGANTIDIASGGISYSAITIFFISINF
jgi:hypothetical protein